MKKILTMTLAAVAFVFGLSACSSSDDEPEVAVAEQVAGSYTGEEVMTVSGEVFNSFPTYVFTKASDTTLDMTIPASDGGSMMLPSLPVKNIVLTKSGNNISGRLDSFTGTVINASGAEKSYTVSGMAVLFHDNMVVVSYTLKYGNMPFDFAGQFTGTKK